MSEAPQDKDKFDTMIDEWLKDVPLLPEFKDFFVPRVQKKFIEWLRQVHENSEQVYKSEGRCIALPGDIFKAVKILKINLFSEDIEVFYEHYKKLMDETPEKLEVKALYEQYMKYKESDEYIIESEVTGEARIEQLKCAAQARATWKKEFVQDMYLDFPAAMDTAEFSDIKEQRKLKPEDIADILKNASLKSISAVREAMSSMPTNLHGLKECQEQYQRYMEEKFKDFLKSMYAKSQQLSLQVQELTVEQQKIITEAFDEMIEGFNIKKAERGLDALTATVADLLNEEMQAFLSSEDQSLKRKHY